MLRPKIIDQLDGVSRFNVALEGLLELPDASGSIPPYLFTKGENRIKGSSAVVYILADLKPSFFKKEAGKLYPRLMVLIFTNEPSKNMSPPGKNKNCEIKSAERKSIGHSTFPVWL